MDYSQIKNHNLSFKGISLFDTGTGSLGSSNTCGIRQDKEGIKEIPTEIFCADSKEGWINQYAHFVTNVLNEPEESVLAVMPGSQQMDKDGNQFFTPHNICVGKNKGSIGHIKVNVIENAIKSQLLQKGITLNKFRVLNDGAMHGINAAFMFAKEDNYHFSNPKNEGKIVAVAFPGGGLGVTHFETEKDKVRIIPEQTGHLLTRNIKEKFLTQDQISRIKHLDIEEYSSSAPALIRIYAKALGYNDNDTREIVSKKEGRIVTQHQITLNTNDPEQMKQAESLSESKLFIEISNNNGTKQFILLKDGKPVSKEDHIRALKQAGTEFFKGIGEVFAYYEMTNRCDTILVTTKLAHNLNKALKEQNIDAEKIVEDSAWDNLSDSTRKSIGSPDNQRVIIKNAGEPCSIQNAEAILNGSTQGKFRVIELPKEIFAKE